MKTSVRLALVGAFIQAATAAVHFPFAKHASTGHSSASSSSRRRAVSTDVFYGANSYVVNASIGTPGQSVSLALSSGSSDTWVIDARSQFCAYTYDYGYDDDDDDDYSSIDDSYTIQCVWGTFASNQSSSYKPQDSGDDENESYYDYDFDVTYDDGSYAWGDYFYDVITLGGVTVSNFTLGLVNETDMVTGVLGIGYNDSSYSNLPDRLQEQGLINSTAYSIWLDDEQASSGNLLFGAIDTTKFDGNLTRVSSYYSYFRMTVQIASINGTTSDSGGPIAITYGDTDDDDSSSSSYSSDYLFIATFSPSDTLSNLPTDVASQIWEIAGAYYNSDLELAVISCTAASDTTTNFTLQLGGAAYGPIITATMADLVIPADEVNLTTYYSYYLSDDENTCLFGVQNSTLEYSTNTYNLGGTLLRRTYSVFDLVNNEVAVAPVKFGATATSNIVPFETYGASVPSSTLYCIYSSCYETTSGGTGSDSDADADGTLPAGVLSVPALIGMSLGIGLGALALGVIGFLLWRHRLDKKKAGKEPAAVSSAEAGRAPPLAPRQHAARGPEVNAARGPAPAPEMAEAAVLPAVGEGKGKGKEPEAPAPAALSSADEHPETSATADSSGVHDTEAAHASSSREV